MAESIAARLSLDDVRTSVKRMQTEGRKLATRLRKDATALVNRPPLDVLADARKRATKAVQELDVQRRRVGTLVIDRLSSLTDEAVARIGLAKAQDVSELNRRVHDLERRIERVTKDARASGPGGGRPRGRRRPASRCTVDRRAERAASPWPARDGGGPAGSASHVPARRARLLPGRTAARDVARRGA